MSISKIELLENEFEKNEEKIDLLECECDKLWGELVEAQAKVRNITDIKNNLKNVNEKINKKIIKLKKKIIILYSNILMNNKRSEYNRNYYEKHREEIIKKHLEYYHENKEYINNRNKEYFVNYYQQNKQRILTRVQNNYYLKVGRIKKPEKIKIKNEILENNIVISLMD
jgi:hypothetical protein